MTMTSSCRAATSEGRTEAALLHLLLIEHPACLTSDELVLRMAPVEAISFAERDAVLRAVTSLVGSGLVRHSGMHVALTHAAVCAGRLLDL